MASLSVSPCGVGGLGLGAPGLVRLGASRGEIPCSRLASFRVSLGAAADQEFFALWGFPHQVGVLSLVAGRTNGLLDWWSDEVMGFALF